MASILSPVRHDAPSMHLANRRRHGRRIGIGQETAVDQFLLPFFIYIFHRRIALPVKEDLPEVLENIALGTFILIHDRETPGINQRVFLFSPHECQSEDQRDDQADTRAARRDIERMIHIRFLEDQPDNDRDKKTDPRKHAEEQK